MQAISAQTIINRDPEISEMVSQVSADSLQSYVHKLVSFTTRSTLSNQTDKTKGIGAARNWVLSKFQAYASQSKCKMVSYIDTTNRDERKF